MEHPVPPHPSYTEPDGLTDGADDAEALVVLEWAVPTAAKVPAPRQRVPMGVITMQPASITSTVPAAHITELRTNNTALNAAWCTTATLAAPLGRV